jgi:hypothetical protein
VHGHSCTLVILRREERRLERHCADVDDMNASTSFSKLPGGDVPDTDDEWRPSAVAARSRSDSFTCSFCGLCTMFHLKGQPHRHEMAKMYDAYERFLQDPDNAIHLRHQAINHLTKLNIGTVVPYQQ